jgi:hypothetical protein
VIEPKQQHGPIICTWEGDGFKPLPGRPLDAARERYKPGERVALVRYDQRSRLSHDHYMVTVRAAWQNWPEDYPVAIASEDQLRKHALIRTDHYDESACAFASPEDAGAYIAMMTRAVDYAEFSTFEDVVIIRIAKTQRKKLMGSAVFQKSKEDVLDFLSAIVGVDVTTLTAEAKRMAA